MLDEGEVGEFVDKVDELSRLIDGLAKGTISPEYIDRKMEQKSKAQDREVDETSSKGSRAPQSAGSAEDAATKAEKAEKDAEKEEERKARLQEKAAELKANYERKLKARARFEEYATSGAAAAKFGTDYTKWDMWCPGKCMAYMGGTLHGLCVALYEECKGGHTHRVTVLAVHNCTCIRKCHMTTAITCPSFTIPSHSHTIGHIIN